MSNSSKYENVMSYTNTKWWQDDYSSFQDENDTALGGMKGLFSVFLSLDYSDWNQGYRGQHHWTNRSRPSYDPSGWLCDEGWLAPCTEQAALTKASPWTITPQNITIGSCLSQQTPGEYCRLQYSAYIIAIIMVCDIVKIIVTCLALRMKDLPCITVGDTLAHFLENPDPVTLNRCLVDGSRARFENRFFWMLPDGPSSPISGDQTAASCWPDLFGPQEFTWEPRRRRWYHATGKLPWLLLWGM